MPAKTRIHAYCDAAYFPHYKDQVVIGMVLLDEDRKQVVRADFRQIPEFPTPEENVLDEATKLNSIMARAELTAVKLVLETAMQFGFTDVQIYCDHLLADRRYKDSAMGKTLTAFLAETRQSVPGLHVVKIDGREGCIPHNICDAFLYAHGKNANLWRINKEHMRELVQKGYDRALSQTYQQPDADPDKKGFYRMLAKDITNEDQRAYQAWKDGQRVDYPGMTSASPDGTVTFGNPLLIPEALEGKHETLAVPCTKSVLAMPSRPPLVPVIQPAPSAYVLPGTPSARSEATAPPFSTLRKRPRAEHFVNLLASSSYGDWIHLPGGQDEYVHIDPTNGTLRFHFVTQGDHIHLHVKTCKCPQDFTDTLLVKAPAKPGEFQIRTAVRHAFKKEAEAAGYPFQDWEDRELKVVTKDFSEHDAIDVGMAEQAWRDFARTHNLSGRKGERHRHTFLCGFFAHQSLASISA